MPVTPDSETSSRCPPEPTGWFVGWELDASRSALGVGDEALVGGVADAALEGAQCFFAGLSFGLLAEVVAAVGGLPSKSDLAVSASRGAVAGSV